MNPHKAFRKNEMIRRQLWVTVYTSCHDTPRADSAEDLANKALERYDL